MPPSTAGPGDQEILAAVRELQERGTPDAFRAIFRRYYPSVHQFFSNQRSVREEADDLAQRTLWRAYQNIRQFQAGTSFAAWIRTIAENIWKNEVRARQAAKRDAIVQSLAPAADSAEERPRGHESPRLKDEHPGPEELALRSERTRVLLNAFSDLPPGMRRCMELRLLRDLEYQEIAEEMGIGLGSVRSQLHEARRRLRPVLEKYFQGAEL